MSVYKIMEAFEAERLLELEVVTANRVQILNKAVRI